MKSELGECFEALVQEGANIAKKLGPGWQSGEGIAFMAILKTGQKILREVKENQGTRSAAE